MTWFIPNVALRPGETASVHWVEINNLPDYDSFRDFPGLKQVKKPKQHLVDVELRLAPGHFPVAGAELADEVVAAGTERNGLN